MCRRLVHALIASLLALGLVLALTGAQEVARAQGHSGLIRVQATDLSELRQWDASIDRMLRQGDLRVRKVQQDTQIPGRTHERLDQVYRGVRVFGGDLTRQIDRGVTVSIFGGLYHGIEIDVTPGLSTEEATATIEKLTGTRANPRSTPELVVLPRDEGGYALAYRMSIRTRDDVTMYFIDARTGAELLKFSDLQRQSAVGSATGVLGDTKKISVQPSAGTFVAQDELRPPPLRTFDMRGDIDRTLDALDGVIALAQGDLAADTDNVWTDGPNVDAHVYTGLTYDYYFKRFARHGLDDNNLRLIGLSHPARREDILTAPPGIIGLFYLNAFFCATCGTDGAGMMVYGVGLPPGLVLTSTGQSVNFFAAALDVVGHELTHGVTAHSSGLGTRNEPGALNEAFSDMMGTSVEFFFQTPGSGLRQADYLIGEDVFTPGGIRSLADPGSLGDPDHYSKRFLGSADNGGVHTNSTIASHAFYLAIEGGTNRTSGLSVQGVGASHRDQIEKVFYRAFTLLLPSNASFLTAQSATIQAARDLFGAGSAPETAVTQAWKAVGVTEPDTHVRITFSPDPAPVAAACGDPQPSWEFVATATETAGIGFKVADATLGFYDASGRFLGGQNFDFAEFFTTCGGSGTRIPPSGRRCTDICVSLGGLSSGAIDLTLRGTNDRGALEAFVSPQLTLLSSSAFTSTATAAGKPQLRLRVR